MRRVPRFAGQRHGRPDLTDDTWLHGGSTKEIFHTIWNGVPEKGMKPWKGSLSGKQVAEVIAYIHSIKRKLKKKKGHTYVTYVWPLMNGYPQAKLFSNAI